MNFYDNKIRSYSPESAKKVATTIRQLVENLRETEGLTDEDVATLIHAAMERSGLQDLQNETLPYTKDDSRAPASWQQEHVQRFVERLRGIKPAMSAFEVINRLVDDLRYVADKTEDEETQAFRETVLATIPDEFRKEVPTTTRALSLLRVLVEKPRQGLLAFILTFLIIFLVGKFL